MDSIELSLVLFLNRSSSRFKIRLNRTKLLLNWIRIIYRELICLIECNKWIRLTFLLVVLFLNRVRIEQREFKIGRRNNYACWYTLIEYWIRLILISSVVPESRVIDIIVGFAFVNVTLKSKGESFRISTLLLVHQSPSSLQKRGNNPMKRENQPLCPSPSLFNIRSAKIDRFPRRRQPIDLASVTNKPRPDKPEHNVSIICTRESSSSSSSSNAFNRKPLFVVPSQFLGRKEKRTKLGFNHGGSAANRRIDGVDRFVSPAFTTNGDEASGSSINDSYTSVSSDTLRLATGCPVG